MVLRYGQKPKKANEDKLKDYFNVSVKVNDYFK